MQIISNAFLSEAELVQVDRWAYGPLELVFVDIERRPFANEPAVDLATVEWNRWFRGGFTRPGNAMDVLTTVIPALESFNNPNLFIAPRVNGFTELHAMLASVVPKAILERHGIGKVRANFWLLPVGRDEATPAYAQACVRAFEEHIWARLSRARRLKRSLFASDSPLRLLAGDHCFWMSRLYRIAAERAEAFEETSDEKWKPLEVLEAQVRSELPPEEQEKYIVRRPLKGGDLWCIEDDEECEEVIEEMIDGAGVMESLEPVLDVLHSHHTHEDFSDRYSWVKEDFERSFYSKRSKVKISLVETLDDFPVWSASEPDGYANVLFRDILCAFNARDRHIILALRQGKTTTEISRDSGHRGHAAVARRVKAIKAKIRALLQ